MRLGTCTPWAGRGDKDKDKEDNQDKEDNKDKEDMEGRDLPADDQQAAVPDLKEESDDVVEGELLLSEAEKDLAEILYAEGRLLSDLENCMDAKKDLEDRCVKLNVNLQKIDEHLQRCLLLGLRLKGGSRMAEERASKEAELERLVVEGCELDKRLSEIKMEMRKIKLVLEQELERRAA